MLVWTGTALAIVATLPQLLHTLQTWKVEDLNSTSIGLALVSNILFFLHSVRTKDWGYVVLTTWFLLYGLILSYVKFTSGSRDSRRDSQVSAPAPW
jgi:uncharacterized protein with PQ loop repeat